MPAPAFARACLRGNERREMQISNSQASSRVLLEAFPFAPAQAGAQTFSVGSNSPLDARWRGHERREPVCEFQCSYEIANAPPPVLFVRRRVRLSLSPPLP